MSRISEKLSESQMILKNNQSIAKKSIITNKQVEKSHPDCEFCLIQFMGLDEEDE
jgi:hypothetical protein